MLHLSPNEFSQTPLVSLPLCHAVSVGRTDKLNIDFSNDIFIADFSDDILMANIHNMFLFCSKLILDFVFILFHVVGEFFQVFKYSITFLSKLKLLHDC